MCSAERTLLRQRHHGMSFRGMPPMVEERRPRREEFSEPCTVIDRTFRPAPASPAPAIHLCVTIRRPAVTAGLGMWRKRVGT
ncbi:hypothetical protein GCM10010335_29600 [Streptomyces galbus]|nr:hypothetical protein GCM10010335_29600 [Streptomyces galbus]